jgi:hypothetical protein
MDKRSEIPAIELSLELNATKSSEQMLIRMRLERYAAERVLEEHKELCRAKNFQTRSPYWGHPYGCQCGCSYICERRKVIERAAGKGKGDEKA